MPFHPLKETKRIHVEGDTRPPTAELHEELHGNCTCVQFPELFSRPEKIPANGSEPCGFKDIGHFHGRGLDLNESH